MLWFGTDFTRQSILMETLLVNDIIVYFPGLTINFLFFFFTKSASDSYLVSSFKLAIVNLTLNKFSLPQTQTTKSDCWSTPRYKQTGIRAAFL